ncbi:hypothetical protein V491_06106 [Pseudogymnoascus sp. VKM F-3775]|nr:hypothetical protein V491_06106 [Pseudogymnoascus sp. VKM F-3775]
MGNCGSTYNLQQCSAKINEPVDADQGVIGIGVLVGFIATALLTFGAIILGYLTTSLPKENLTTDDDDRIIKRVVSSCIGRMSHKIWRKFTWISRKCLCLKPLREEGSLDDSQRQEALKKFVLTLSDQQLVTGVAILVAGFANWCTMSVYELNMVIALAWFSSATHLATLDVLRGYFQQNRVVRNWRMIGMVTIVLLLIAGLLLTGFYTNNFLLASAPLPCLKYLASVERYVVYNCNGTIYFSTNQTIEPTNNATLIDSSTYYTECNAMQYALVSQTVIFSALGRLFTVLYLIYGYSSAILQSISTSPNKSLTLSNVALYVLFRHTSDRKKHVSMEIIQNAFLEIKARRKARQTARNNTLDKTFMGAGLAAQHFTILATYSESFLYHIGGLFFALSYGVSQVVANRWNIGAPKVQEGSNRVDFGQIMSLVLLVLPLLAAVEIFHANDDKQVHVLDTENETSTPVTTDDNSHAYNDLHNMVSSENEQAHASLPNSASVPSVASSLNDPHSLANSALTIAQTPQDNEKRPGEGIGVLFLCHVVTAIGVGVLLNVTTEVVIAGPTVIGIILVPIFFTYLSDALSVSRILVTARRNNTLESYKDSAWTLGEAIELSVVTSGSMSQSTSPARSAIAAKVTAGGQDVVIERVVAHDSPEMGEHSQSLHSTVSHTTILGPREKDVTDEGGEICVKPNRQDTESGLRGLRD